MSRLLIFTKNEQQKFDAPPKFNKKERALAFTASEEVKAITSCFRSLTNKVGFVLQLGYFKSSGKFFQPTQFREEDIQYVTKLFSDSCSLINFSKYTTKSKLSHQTTILKLQSWNKFSDQEKKRLISEIKKHVKQQLHPKQLMHIGINYLVNNKIVLPSYHCIADIITDSFNKFEHNLLTILKTKLTLFHVNKLDALLGDLPDAKNPEDISISFIKKVNQSLRPTEITKNVELFEFIKQHYKYFQAIIDELNLSEQATEYYAVWVGKATIHQLNQFKDKFKSYLYLLTYIKHQYYLRNYILVDIFLKSVVHSKNMAVKTMKKMNEHCKQERRETIKKLTQSNKNHVKLISNIEDVLKSSIVNDTDKIIKINELINKYNEKSSVIEQSRLDDLEEYASGDKENYYQCLSNESNKLQRRVSNILQALDFNTDTSDSTLLPTIEHYKSKSSKVNKTAPKDFLNKQECTLVSKNNKFDIALYKILLFCYIADDIKSGRLNFINSYNYLSIYDYLIDKEIWDKNRKKILKDSGLSKFNDFSTVEKNLKQELNDLIKQVNDNYNSGNNEHISLDKDNIVNVKTPATDSSDLEFISKLLSQDGVKQVPIFNLLLEVDSVTKFTKNFKHHSTKNNRKDFRIENVLAGIIGIGCNIGVHKIANISKGVNLNSLKNTVTWYFNLKNIQSSNNAIIAYINKLPLPNVFCNNQGDIHTSSDGQKINVSVDSLLANYSFKYFGKNKGVSIYTFIDEKQSLFYSTVISSSEREAAYVIDGLMANDVVKSSIHSTDTHGFTETIFGSTFLIETAFAPRIKKIGKQKLYSFSSKSLYEKKGYKILPDKTVNVKLIRENWDEILRFIATIKTKHTPASYLFRRLSSYSKQHPLYNALKEFGRIIKSIFIYKYYDDLKLRQQMEKQLNRVELSNKFSKAILFANNQEFKESLKQEQELIVACRGLADISG